MKYTKKMVNPLFTNLRNLYMDWNRAEKLVRYTTQISHRRTFYSTYAFTMKSRKKSSEIIFIWVDNIILAASTETILNKIKSFLGYEFKMKDLKIFDMFPRHCIQVDRWLCWNDSSVLQKFNMTDSKPKIKPCEIRANKIRDEDSTKLTNPKFYGDNDIYQTRSMLYSYQVIKTYVKPY